VAGRRNNAGVPAGVRAIAGANIGARLHHRLPELWLRRLLGILVLAIAIRYVSEFIG
jgi:uncharacterized membrane protein YfcA